MWHKFWRILTAGSLLFVAALIQGQTAGTEAPSTGQSAATAKPQFFSGTVTTLDSDHITVSRSLVGKAPETRTFAIRPTTKVAKSVKAKAKVTVRYQHEKADGDVALEIQTRSSWHFSRS